MDTRAVAAAFYRPELQPLLPLFLFENAARLNELSAINLTHFACLRLSLHLLCVITLRGQKKCQTNIHSSQL